jgi:hypothetical protein
MNLPASANPSPTAGRELAAGLLGSVIAFGCVLPPLIHLLTGPIGPFIGGFIAAQQVKPGPRGQAIIAGTIGTVLGGAAAAAAALIRSSSPKGLPDWFPSPDLFSLIVAGVFVYGAALGFAGSKLSAALATSRAAATDAPPSDRPSPDRG